jgi:predicted RNA-binding Zn ribbon-like protein
MLAAEQAEGQAPPFTFRSDRLSLDFVATLMFRGARSSELLAGPGALGRWARAAGLAELDGPEDLAAAVALREAIYRLSLARIAHEQLSPQDITTINSAAAGAPLSPALTRDGALERRGSALQLLSTLARDAIELLGSGDGERLRQCSREGCTRLYLDRSRGATRIWCGMRECGNRVNAAAYRRRRSAG